MQAIFIVKDRVNVSICYCLHIFRVSKHVSKQDSIPEDVEEARRGEEEAGRGEEKGEGFEDSLEEGAGLEDTDDDIECDDDIYVNGNSGSFIHPDVASFNSNLLHTSPNIRYRSDSEEEEEGVSTNKHEINGQQSEQAGTKR